MCKSELKSSLVHLLSKFYDIVSKDLHKYF